MTQTIFPALRYRDADAALSFLKDAFGATEHALYRGDDGAIHHGEVMIAGGMVMIGTAAPDAAPPADELAITLYLVVGDPDAHHATAAAAGAQVIRGPEDMDYGSREYSVRDPGGHIWTFGTYDPNP